MPASFRFAAAVAVVVGFGFAIAGCGGSDYFLDEAGRIVRVVYLAPGESAEVRAIIGTDTPQGTVVTAASLDPSVAEVTLLGDERLALRGAGPGEATLSVVASLEGAELRPRTLEVGLRVVVAEAPARADLVGTWRNDGPPNRVPFWLELAEDGTYRVVLSEDRADAPLDEGTWSLDGHGMTIVSGDGTTTVARVRLVDGELVFAAFPWGGTVDYLEYAMTRVDG